MEGGFNGGDIYDKIDPIDITSAGVKSSSSSSLFDHTGEGPLQSSLVHMQSISAGPSQKTLSFGLSAKGSGIGKG